jgi:hypothetical protein
MLCSFKEYSLRCLQHILYPTSLVEVGLVHDYGRDIMNVQ